jgi:hypothetical protein
MPVTTRSTAARNKSNEATTLPDEQIISKNACSKRSKKCSSKDTPKQIKPQSGTSSIESKTYSSVEQASSNPQAESPVQGDHHYGHEDIKPDDEVDLSLESLFYDQRSLLTSQENQIVSQETNKNPTTTASLAHQTPPLLSKLSSSTSAVTKSPSTANEGELKQHTLLSLVSSDEDNFDLHNDESSTIGNKPVVKGNITFGTSTRGGRMIFMNQYSYIRMNETKSMIGWRCSKRNENCKAVIYTLKSTGEFSRWNGQFHCHGVDLSDTRKREILTKIKSRVLDEYISIKLIIEEEYRKANLSTEEKKIMPLPVQIGI